MHIVPFIAWLIAIVLFAVETARTHGLTPAGLLAATFTIGAHFMIVGGDRITWDL